MKKYVIIAIVYFCMSTVYSQGIPDIYYEHIAKAESLYEAKQYRDAANEYSQAFKSNNWRGLVDDRYNSARNWALSSVPDSAFFQLNRIVDKTNYNDFNKISNDKDFLPLYSDPRWQPLIDKIRMSREKMEANYNRPLIATLDSIYFEDQHYRVKSNDIEEKFGWDSKEMKLMWDTINAKDAKNLIKVKAILDKYGWLGMDVVGRQGNTTLFLVIQHSDQKTQEQYLPMMRDAVKNGKAQGSSLALLEDRVALGQGKRQLYGSQVSLDKETEKYYVLPLEDPDNVDKRREEVGLGPIADYISNWKMIWDVEQYKKDLPEIERKAKNR